MLSLLEADVEFQVARSFIDRVKEQALGQVVQVRVKHKDKKLSIAPGQYFINLCHKELIRLMGPADSSLNLRTKPVSSLMMVGLQGSGKTTTAAKLARLLTKSGKKPMLVAADVYRPAAVEQLRKLGADLNIPVFADGGAEPPEICRESMREAAIKGCDVAIFDTAGRLTVDGALMEELRSIRELTAPDDILLVCDAMIGQDSVNIAKSFNERIPLTGFILTKLDGDARGGAALSIKEATGVPSNLSVWARALDRLEEFRPEGLASRILGFGDIVGLVKDFEEAVDEKQAEEDAARMLMGQFSLDRFLGPNKGDQEDGAASRSRRETPVSFPVDLPASSQVDDYELVRIESIINSMTPTERRKPDILDQSRINRIAQGAGRKESEVKDLLTKFKDMRDLMSAMGGGKIRGPLERDERTQADVCRQLGRSGFGFLCITPRILSVSRRSKRERSFLKRLWRNKGRRVNWRKRPEKRRENDNSST